MQRACSTAVAVLVAAVTLTACSSGVSTDGTQPAAPSATASPNVPGVVVTPGDGIAAPSPPSDDSGTAALPAGFPLPPGARVSAGTTSNGSVNVPVTVTSMKAAYDFWVRALPAAGYSVSSLNETSGFDELNLSGHGYGPNSQIAISGTRATVLLSPL